MFFKEWVVDFCRNIQPCSVRWEPRRHMAWYELREPYRPARWCTMWRFQKPTNGSLPSVSTQPHELNFALQFEWCCSSVALRLSLSKVEWVSILKLSTKWQFLDLRKLAKSELEAGKDLDSVEKIVLGRECYNSSWVLAGYQELVQKSDAITDDEAIDIELPTAINLCRIREIMLRQSLTLALRVLRNVFAEEPMSWIMWIALSGLAGRRILCNIPDSLT